MLLLLYTPHIKPLIITIIMGCSFVFITCAEYNMRAIHTVSEYVRNSVTVYPKGSPKNVVWI